MVIKIIALNPAVQQDSTQSSSVNSKPEEVKVSEQKNEPVFMKPNDVSTATEEQAVEIGEFLNSRKVRKQRRAELTNYLLEQTDSNGVRVYSEDQAEDLAKDQVKNERDQARAKVTIPFIDKEAYEKFKEQLKLDGKEDLYEPTLIKNKKVLAMINGDNLPTIEEKEANYKKYFMTDENGELIKGADGKYIFDPEKYKAEMVKDTSGYRLTLAGRAQHAEERGISRNAEKDAIKAAGLGYRKDRTWLYRSLLIGAGVATAVWGGATATAVAGAGAGAVTGGASAEAGAIARATATNRVGQILGPLGFFTAAALVKDKDGKDTRGDAQKVFENLPPEEQPPVEEKPPVEEQPPVEEPPVVICEEPPCMRPQQLPPDVSVISTIVGGGPYHYAQLYVDENGNPLKKGSKEFLELQRKLSSGEFSIQTVDKKHRELRNTIQLESGVVKLADDADAKAKEGFDDARVIAGTGDRKYAKVVRNGKWIVVYCKDGKQVPGTGSFATQQEAQKLIDLITTPAK